MLSSTINQLLDVVNDSIDETSPVASQPNIKDLIASPDVNIMGYQKKGIKKSKEHTVSSVFMDLLDQDDFLQRVERMPDRGPFIFESIKATGALDPIRTAANPQGEASNSAASQHQQTDDPSTTAETPVVESPTLVHAKALILPLIEKYKKYPLSTSSDNMRPKDAGDNMKCGAPKTLSLIGKVSKEERDRRKANQISKAESSLRTSNLHETARRTGPKFIARQKAQEDKNKKIEDVWTHNETARRNTYQYQHGTESGARKFTRGKNIDQDL